MKFKILISQSLALNCLVTYFYTPLSLPHCSVMAIGALEHAITILQKNGYNSETVHKLATKGPRDAPCINCGENPNLVRQWLLQI